VVGLTIAGLYGPWVLPWVLALLLALLGGGAGLVALISVFVLVPISDPHRRSRTLTDEGTRLTGVVWLGLGGSVLTAAPAVAVLVVGQLRGSAALLWAGVAVGLATGWLCYWGMGLLAYRRLRARGPEMLATLVRGPAPASTERPPAMRRLREHFGVQGLPTRKAVLVAVCWSLCWLPLFPQGLVPAVLTMLDEDVRSWFLAMYLPGPLQLPVALAFVVLGLAMLGYAWRMTSSSPERT
jgi:ABC-2 type transport system permease protein